MPKFHRTKKFIKLDKKWKKKLKAAGFDDIEDEHENLKQHDVRTAAWEDKVAIEEFFRRLRFFLSDHPELPEKIRQILGLYADGVLIKEIGAKAETSSRHVREVVYKYEKLSAQIGNTDKKVQWGQTCRKVRRRCSQPWRVLSHESPIIHNSVVIPNED